MVPSKVDDLLALLELQVNASQTKLRKICSRQEKLSEILSDLADQRSETLAPGRRQDVGMVTFQNELRLRRWIDQRRESVNAEMAQTHALLAMARADLSKHIARHNALQAVAKRAHDRDLLVQRRRDDYCC